jgi:hypothetical protein
MKSVTLATLLGLDPIPGDALLYAGEYVQASVNFVVGGASAVGLYYGLSGWACDNEQPGCGIKGFLVALGSSIPYLAMLAWDGIVGIDAVREHNERVGARASILQTVRPTLAVTQEGAFVGAVFNF